MIILKEDKRKLGREVHKVRTWERTGYCQVRRVPGQGKLGLSNA